MEDAHPGSSLFGSLVRVVTKHVISSSSMVSRAILTDSWRGVLVTTGDGDLWLAATLDALRPDNERLLRRGEENGGPPVKNATASLVKLSISWGDAVGRSASGGEAHIANPTVVEHPGGASIGVVPLAKVRDLSEAVEEGLGPVPLTLRRANPYEETGFDVVTLFQADDGRFWPITREARRASAPSIDFLDQPGAVALDLRLEAEDAGSPAFFGDESSPAFLGLVRPVSADLAMLLPSGLIRETIASVGATNDPGI